jgi:nucleobase:cation symporter-1, NCS1 family
MSARDPSLWNADLAPSNEEQRRWTWPHIASLWVGMVVCVPTYLLASGLIQQGMSWQQAVCTVLLGNLIVLLPMLLIGHAGTKYGIPFPVLLRASFGTRGAALPSMLRALVACGWFGIQTWIGGQSVYTVINIVSDSAIAGTPIGWLGIDPGQLACFIGFWLLQVYFIVKGTESIRWLETIAAPFLLAMGFALLWWAYSSVGSWGAMLTGESQFVAGGLREGQFWAVFWPSLTAMVGFWATLTLNIPDFTRFAKNQREQIIGQCVGLPVPMALFSFIGVAVASATAVIYGEAIWDPVVLAGKFGGLTTALALVALIIATLTTNLAANVVAPANGFSNLSPRHISFRTGGIITAGLGIAIMPWKLLASSGDYIFVWLVGYSSLLGPIAGILIADYFFVRKQTLDIEALFDAQGQYQYRNGWNPWALLAFAVAVLPNLPGFLAAGGFVEQVAPFWSTLYGYAWFVGAFLAAGIYTAAMLKCPRYGLKAQAQMA